MRRVLIIKTSSMGDVIHTLPALTDAQRLLPGILFDWVVEEGFAEIPSWHPAVDRVIPVAIRRWRKNIVRSLRGTEVRHFKAELARHHYDLVIDAQGLMKSAWITRFINAPCVGYDRRSVRESFASMAYKLKVPVSRDMHAVERTRELFAAALNYPKPVLVGEYQLDKKSFRAFDPAERSLVFIHSTTQSDKHWPEVYWRKLCELTTAEGYTVNLPWGTEAEKARSLRLAAGLNNIEVLPKLNLKSIASVLNQATGVVSVDTGLGHLSAALDKPTVSLYGPTSPKLIGAYGQNQVHLSAKNITSLRAIAPGIVPEVFQYLTPDIVFAALQSLLNRNETLDQS